MVRANDIIELFGPADIRIDTSSLTEDEPLRTYGADSLDIANLIFQVERQYGLTISPTQSAGLRSLRDFVELVNGVTSH
jgi:acyl carrier protein